MPEVYFKSTLPMHFCSLLVGKLLYSVARESVQSVMTVLSTLTTTPKLKMGITQLICNIITKFVFILLPMEYFEYELNNL